MWFLALFIVNPYIFSGEYRNLLGPLEATGARRKPNIKRPGKTYIETSKACLCKLVAKRGVLQSQSFKWFFGNEIPGI